MSRKGLISSPAYAFGLARICTTQPDVPNEYTASWSALMTGSYHAFLSVSCDKTKATILEPHMVDSLLGDQPALIAFQLILSLLLPYHNAAKARNMLQGCTAGSSVQMIFWPLLPSPWHFWGSIIWCSSTTWPLIKCWSGIYHATNSAA